MFGYRPQLYTDLTNAGTSVHFVGSATNDSTSLLTTAGQTHHDGHSGWFIADTATSSNDNNKGIYDKVQEWYGGLAVPDKPDVILLMIGTNDLNGNNQVSTAPARFELLLTRLETLRPSARIIVGSVPKASETNNYKNPTVTNLNASITAFNTSIEGIVGSHASNGKLVEFLDVNAAMLLSDLGGDGLHFSQSGYNKLGSLWASAVQSVSYGAWAAANAGGGLVSEDADSDGVSNGIEFFMGESGASFTASPGLNALNKVAWPNGGNISYAEYGIRFVVQTSFNLSDWTDVVGSDRNLTNLAGSVAYVLPAGADNRFVRLLVKPN